MSQQQLESIETHLSNGDKASSCISENIFHETTLEKMVPETLHQAWNEMFEFKLNKIAAITNEGLSDSHLVEMLRDMRKSFKLYERTIISPHFKSTGQVLPENEKRENKNSSLFPLQIKVDLCYCEKFGDKGAKVLAKEIVRTFPNLQRLIISFACCNKLTNQSLEVLGIEIGRNIKCLKELSFNFYYCLNLGDVGLSTFSKEICTGLRSLTKLNLNFCYCESLSDWGIKNLMKDIGQNLKDLNYLVLDLNSCVKLTDRSLRTITSEIRKNLMKIQFLQIDFRSCPKVTSGSSNMMRKDLIQCLPNLQILVFDGKRTLEKTIEHTTEKMNRQ